MSFNTPPHPGASSGEVAARMARAPKKDTAPELGLRRELHRRGLRFRIGYPVPGNRRRSIDVAFTRARLGVFVDGCFWHGCPVHGTRPSANSDWWNAKFNANRQRDRDTDRLMQEAGWRALRIWEHVAPMAAADMVEEELIEQRRQQ